MDCRFPNVVFLRSRPSPAPPGGCAHKATGSTGGWRENKHDLKIGDQAFIIFSTNL